MVVPEEIQVEVSLENTGRIPISDIKVCRENGSVVRELGALNEGESARFQETITPTDTQLNEGAIPYLVCYTLGKGGPLAREERRPILIRITRLPALPGVEFTRSLPVGDVKPGEEAAIVYRLRNTGNVQLTSLTIEDGTLGQVGALDRLNPGEQQAIIHRFTALEPVSSQPVLRYSHRATQDFFEAHLSELWVHPASEHLEIALTADRSAVSPGDVVRLNYTVLNGGTLVYDKLSLSDQVLGAMHRFSGRLLPGGRLDFSKQVALESTTTFQFLLEAISEGGSEVKASSNPLTIAVSQPDGVLSLSLSAVPDKDVLAAPGFVTFALTVHNGGESQVRNVRLSEREHGHFKTLAVLAQGDTPASVTYPVDREQSFVFAAELEDERGGHLTVLSAPVTVAFGPGGQAGGTTPQPGDVEAMAGAPSYQVREDDSTYAGMIVGALLVLVPLAVYVILKGSANRRRRKRRNNQHIWRLRQSYRRSLVREEEQDTKPNPVVSRDTLRHAKVKRQTEQDGRRPGTPHGPKIGSRKGKQ